MILKPENKNKKSIIIIALVFLLLNSSCAHIPFLDGKCKARYPVHSDRFKNEFIRVKWDGEIKDGFANGYGTAIFDDNTTFKGYFLNGVADGCGTFISGKYKLGAKWSNGILNGEATEDFGGLVQIGEDLFVRYVITYYNNGYPYAGISFNENGKPIAKLKDVIKQKNGGYTMYYDPIHKKMDLNEVIKFLGTIGAVIAMTFIGVVGLAALAGVYSTPSVGLLLIPIM